MKTISIYVFKWEDHEGHSYSTYGQRRALYNACLCVRGGSGGLGCQVRTNEKIICIFPSVINTRKICVDT